MRWKQNNVFDSIRKILLQDIISAILVITVGGAGIYYVSHIHFNDSIITTLIGEIMLISIASLYGYISISSLYNNPKKIRWNDKGIYWIDYRDKYHNITWDQIHNIFEYKDPLTPSKDYDTYLVQYRSGFFSLVSGIRVKKRIGKQIESYYADKRWGVE